mgnify:FL=1
MGIEVSLKDSGTTEELLSIIVKMAIYPLRVLMNYMNKGLTPNFQSAISRIFRVLDSDFRSCIQLEDIREMERKVFSRTYPSYALANLFVEFFRDREDSSSSQITKEDLQMGFEKLLEGMRMSYCWVL